MYVTPPLIYDKCYSRFVLPERYMFALTDILQWSTIVAYDIQTEIIHPVNNLGSGHPADDVRWRHVWPLLQLHQRTILRTRRTM